MPLGEAPPGAAPCPQEYKDEALDVCSVRRPEAAMSAMGLTWRLMLTVYLGIPRCMTHSIGRKEKLWYKSVLPQARAAHGVLGLFDSCLWSQKNAVSPDLLLQCNG